MPATAVERRVARNNSAKRSNELIGRAAKHAGWAGAALESAARDLDGTWGADGNALSGLVEVVQDEATRVSNLAKEIESRSTFQRDFDPDRSARSRPKRNQPRRGRIVDAVAQVLSEHHEPLQAREVHVRVEELLNEPVRWASVKATLAGNIRGPAPRFQRVARGRYTILSWLYHELVLRFLIKRAPIKRFAKGFPIARVLVAAEIAWMAWAHLAKLNRAQRRRTVTLLVKSRGRPSYLSDAERDELAALVAAVEPRLLLGSVARRLSPLPVPKRVPYGPRDSPARKALARRH